MLGFSQSAFIDERKVSFCLLPGCLVAPLYPMFVLGQGHPCAVDFSSSQALPPFTLYLRTLQTVLEPISMCKHLRDFGTSFNILHIDTGWFPSAPLGRGERALLWPMKQVHFILLLYI